MAQMSGRLVLGEDLLIYCFLFLVSFPSKQQDKVQNEMATSLDESNLNQDIPLIKDQANDYVNDKNAHNDDTDRDNDDEDVNGDEFLMSPQQPPPIPITEPPPMPGQSRPKQDDVDPNTNLPSDEIKKALLDNMKCVENWKIEQEMLMKVANESSHESVSRILIETLSGFQRKYEEEQMRIEMSLKLDLEKVKEEENQRREQVSSSSVRRRGFFQRLAHFSSSKCQFHFS